MQIFSLHWMLQNIRSFNVCEAQILITFCIINRICRTILHPSLLVTLLKLFILFVMGVLEQPASETLVHNVMTIL